MLHKLWWITTTKHLSDTSTNAPFWATTLNSFLLSIAILGLCALYYSECTGKHNVWSGNFDTAMRAQWKWTSPELLCHIEMLRLKHSTYQPRHCRFNATIQYVHNYLHLTIWLFYLRFLWGWAIPTTHIIQITYMNFIQLLQCILRTMCNINANCNIFLSNRSLSCVYHVLFILFLLTPFLLLTLRALHSKFLCTRTVCVCANGI